MDLIPIPTYIVVGNRFQPPRLGQSQLKHAFDVPDRGIAWFNVSWGCKSTALEQRLKLCVVLAKAVLANSVCELGPLVYIRFGCIICWTTTGTMPG